MPRLGQPAPNHARQAVEDWDMDPLTRELDDMIQQMERNVTAVKEMASIIVDGQRANDHLIGRMNGLLAFTQGRLVTTPLPAETAPETPAAPDPYANMETPLGGQPERESWAETFARINSDAQVPPLPEGYGEQPLRKVATR